MKEPKIAHYNDIDELPVNVEGASGVTIRWLVSDRDGAPHFQMRLFQVSPGGSTPLHEHPWEHEIFILEGTGKVVLADGERNMEAGYFLFIPPGVMHSFKNSSSKPLKFLCMVPSGAK